MKVAAFKLFGLMPGGSAVHRYFQQNITESLRVTEGRVLQKIQVGIEYLDSIEQILETDRFGRFTHVDIGAGWMPTIPLLFYSSGFDRQSLLDINPNLDVRIVSDVVQTFRQVVAKDKNLHSRCQRLPPIVHPSETLEAYLTRLGIRYVAPYSAKDLVNDQGFKIVTCTQILLHLSKQQLRSLFQAVSLALAEGGLFLAPVHLYDIYSDFDKALSPYNKWRYSDFVWERLINSKMMTFNRLTASEYRRLLEASGLDVVKYHVPEPTDSDLQQFRRIKVHKQFSNVPERELAARYLFFAAKAT
jgi:hypothetical protein